ncbi:hypothetical protein SERLA73DRAFT_181234 [Serpula lacrymans var. lacrymans S7.3]|uniref:Enoyl reductase (ER) domain-containing protein n=2 Tax=Serpula lacrymans var. lacrymans TaxID=341189 RepID=F8PXP8_SERL3|nr:uncharacterized protein SERLADRAFT_467286 [Serpula lacrymans var. lacrymans S7.9]EGN98661.1 hypothetical protein SERLA73DRAFT_181234 [Serpula lacrymans var. lacrymans S7.3]EGO24265.1 hypothetical protein SERLADRAFT_467286 [Serpula lacrymans var. lacrymans S7.9]
MMLKPRMELGQHIRDCDSELFLIHTTDTPQTPPHSPRSTLAMPSELSFAVFKGSEAGKVVQSISTRERLLPDEVLLKVTHSGVCGTDVHFKSKDIVLGHEGVGIIEQIGSGVKAFSVGDRAGFGFLQNACENCAQCRASDEIYCHSRQIYGLGILDQGSFATYSIQKAAFIFPIPSKLDSAYAAPLMCAGATVFNALFTGNVRPADRVGVIGVGGLGHLAIQFAAKMGCEVTVFSSSDSKKQEALQLGATEFYATRGMKTLEGAKEINHLLVTTSAQPDWDLYIPIMAPRGTIFPLSVSQENLVVPYMPLVVGGLRIQGSLVCSRGVHSKMLEFAATQGIKPFVETFDMSVEGIEQAFERMEQGKLRYRAVLVAKQ